MKSNVFTPQSVELAGGFDLEGPAAAAFELFSPLGERDWVPEWSPELLYPPGTMWQRGQIFRTPGDRHPAVWVITDLDRGRHLVEYHRVEPDRYLARVRVRCIEQSKGKTEVRVSYLFVGLSDAGNEEIAGMGSESFAKKMQQWKQWIDASLHRRTPD
jgi:hypothetical protein